MIQDVRTLRRPTCNSDHYLVKTMITQKLIRMQKNSNKEKMEQEELTKQREIKSIQTKFIQQTRNCRRINKSKIQH